MALDYLHIGASRTGTTWLYKNMVLAHPQLVSPTGGKQPAFWNQAAHMQFHRERGVKNWQKWKRPMSWYVDLYQDRNNGEKLVDFTDGNAWMAPIDSLRTIKDLYPNVKITYAIRNPITTIWSHVVKHDKLVASTAAFSEIKAALLNPAYVYNTHYLENIDRWLNIFSKDQFMVFLYTDILNPVPLLKKLAHHVDIDATIWNNVPKNQLTQKVNVGSCTVPIRQDVLDFLVQYHKHQIEQLEHILDQDLSHWLKGEE